MHYLVLEILQQTYWHRLSLYGHYSWKISIKFNTFHMFWTVHSNFCINLTQIKCTKK